MVKAKDRDSPTETEPTGRAGDGRLTAAAQSCGPLGRNSNHWLRGTGVVER